MSSQNDIIPGHVHLDIIVEGVKKGVIANGGTPVVFTTIGVCDGIAMGHIGMKYSLATRELIADSIECMVNAHRFDALVFIPNCDKIVPGMIMGAIRMNIPSTFISGGPMLVVKVEEKNISLSTIFEAVGYYESGKLSKDNLYEIENKACPTCGSCSGMFTANSMNCLTEVLGLGFHGNGTIPAVYSERIRLAKEAGKSVMNLLENDINPKDIVTKDSILNELTVDMALGCSTIIIVVMNNNVLGMVRQWQNLFYDRRYSQTTLNRKTDIVKLAEAFGGVGFRVTERKQLEYILNKALNSSKPLIIDYVIDIDKKVLPMVVPGAPIN